MELPHLRTSPPPSPPPGLPRELDFQPTTEAVDSAAPAVRSTSSNTTLRAHAARTPSNPFRYINISPLQHTPKDSLFRRASSSGSSLSLFAGGGGGLAAGGAGAERFGLLSPFSGGEPDRQWVYPESSLRNDRDLSMRGLSSGDMGIPPEAVFGPISFARTLTMMASNPSPNFLSHQWSTDISRDPDINEDDTALALESWSVNPPTPPYPNAPYMQRVPSSLLPLAPPFYSLEDLPRRLSITSVASSSPFEADWMPSSPDEQPTSPIADDLARSLQDPLMGIRSGVSDVGHAYNESIQASWRPQRFESSQHASVSRHEPAHLSPSTLLHLASWAPTSVASSSSQPINRRKRTIAQSPSPPPPNEASSHPSSVTQRANSDSPLARTRPSRRVSRKKTFVSSPPSVSRGPKTRSRTSHERSKKAMVAENDPPAAPSQTIPSIILQRSAPIAPLSFARDTSPVLSFPSLPRQSRPTLLDLLSAPPTNSSSASSSLSSTLTLLRDSPSRSSLDASSSAEPSPIPTFSPSPSASPEPSLPFYGEAGDDDSGAGRAPRDGDRKFPSGVQLEPGLNRLYRQFSLPQHLPSDLATALNLSPPPIQPPRPFRGSRGGGQYQAPVLGPMDLYHPRWIRGTGGEKIAICPICAEDEGSEPIALKTKVSAYNYHMMYFHGISPTTGLPFSPPLRFRSVQRPRVNPGERTTMREGKCHACGKWVAVTGVKDIEIVVPEIYWWKHAKSCHGTSRFEDELDIWQPSDLLDRLTMHIDGMPQAQRAGWIVPSRFRLPQKLEQEEVPAPA